MSNRWLRLGALVVLAAGLLVAPKVGSTPVQAAPCTCTVFGTSTPGTPDAGPDSGVNLGMEFHTDVDGFVTAIRFYKGVGNTGTHTGILWEADSTTELSRVVFTGETASGWQTAQLAQPIRVFAGDVYIVSYYAPNAHYAYDTNTLPVNNGVLHGTAGDYAYGGAPGFTNSTSGTTAYYVDVNFETNTIYPQGLWGATFPTPTDTPNSDSDFVTVGTRFTSDITTKVVGIRYWWHQFFYSPPPVTLWQNGTVIATSSWVGLDENTGWYEVYFAAPVTIQAGTEYVASVGNMHGGQAYGSTTNYFTSPYTNGVLHAPTNAGVYFYGTSETFPNQQTSTNFWVSPILANEADINVSAQVQPVLVFSTAPHVGVCNGVSQAGTNTVSASAVQLGHAIAASNSIAAQDLQVITNAPGGYTVWARDSGPLTAGARTIADLAGGKDNGHPGAFTGAGTAAFGYTTSDSALSATGNGANRFTSPSAQWAALSTSDGEVSYLASGPGNKTVCVAYQVGVSAGTQAGNYTTNVIYTAVPTF